jgi:hypothetical protein
MAQAQPTGLFSMPGQPDEPNLFSRSGRPEAHQVLVEENRGGEGRRRGVEVAAVAGELTHREDAVALL